MGKWDFKTIDDMYVESKEYADEYENTLDGTKLTKEVRELVGTLISTLMVNKESQVDGSVAGDTLMLHILLNVEREFTYDMGAPMAVSIEGTMVKMKVNPYLLIKITETPKQVLNIILHECYHLLFEHLTEFSWVFGDREKKILMNIATDCQINQLLKNLPEDTVTLKYVEELVGDKLDNNAGSMYYYEKLYKNKENEKIKEMLKNHNNEGDTSLQDLVEKIKEGKIVDSHDDWNKNKGKEGIVNQVIGNIILDAYNQLSERQRGELSGYLKQSIKRYKKEKSVNWKALVRRGIGVIPVPYKLSKKRINRRLPKRIDLSGKMMDKSVNINVFIDISGSMSVEELGYVLGEIYHIMKDTGSVVVKVIQIDTEIKKVSVLNKKGLDRFNAVGRGGTLFQPAFTWLKENKYNNKNSVSIYFTDGYGESEEYIDRFGYKNMFWVLTGEHATEEDLSCDSNGKIALLKNDAKLNRIKKGW